MTRILRTQIIIAIQLLAITGLIFAPGIAGGNSRNTIVAENPEERPAPPFELAGSDGKVYRLSDYVDSKPIIVWFTNLCKGCQASIPHLDSVYKEQVRPHAQLLAVSLLGKDSVTVEEISEELKFDFPILFDLEGATCKEFVGEYVSASCPARNLFVIDHQGIIRYETHYPGVQETEAISVLRGLIEGEGEN
ncbi:MAG: peroxiredoxin family protein [Candidatus Zixiibacteriota bacterium]